MSKFYSSKRFSLSFLGEEWKEAYIDFQSLTVADIKNNFGQLQSIDVKDDSSVVAGIEVALKVLEERFVKGSGINENKEAVDITREDLKDLPAEVITRGLAFLSQGLAPEVKTPSEAS